MLLYLHGFRSSPHSSKAQRVGQRMAELGLAKAFVCPQLPASPTAAARLIEELARGQAADDLAVIGSSLGGYYATWLAERTGCRAVLLNPATQPFRDLEKYVGVHAVFNSTETIEVLPEHMQEMRALAVPAITRPERYFLVAATGDEVLDWRDMVAKYPGAKQRIIEGSDHGLSDFECHLDEVLEFCGAL